MSMLNKLKCILPCILLLSASPVLYGQAPDEVPEIPADTLNQPPVMLMAAASGDEVVDTYLPSPAYPSMESIAVARNIATPMDYHTGRANVQIPLYQLESSIGAIPISLTYNTSGIKVEDYSTWVGLGWNLNAGGRVTRIVNGYPDERGYSNCIFFNQLLLRYGDNGSYMGYRKVDAWRQTFVGNKNVFDDMVKDGSFDGEPDLFFFDVPGYSGMFIISGDKTIYTIPNQNITITFEDSNFLRSGFVIDTPDGNTYYLGSYDDSREISQVKKNGGKTPPNNDPYTSTWYLDCIVNMHQDTVATFSYEQGTQYTTTYYNKQASFRIPDNNNFDPPTFKNLDIKTEIQPKYLSRIICDDKEVQFHSRQEADSLRVLDGIAVIQLSDNQSAMVIKSYDFEYGTFPHGRLKLNCIKEGFINGQKQMLCDFSYHETVTLPDRSSNQFDEWGYYKPYSGDKEYPKFYVKDKNLTIYGAPRTSLLSTTLACALTQINYLNGRYKKFTYGLNGGIDQTGAYQSIGGLRIYKIEDNPGNSSLSQTVTYAYSGEIPYLHKNYSYYINSNPSIWDDDIIVGITRKSTGYKTDITGLCVGYSRVKEILPNNSYIEYKYHSFRDYDDKAGEVGRVDSENTHTYHEDAYNTVPRSSYFFRRGLLKEKAVYSATAELLEKTEYTYTFTLLDSIPAYTAFHRDGGSNTKRYLSRHYWYCENVELQKVKTTGLYQPASEVTYQYNEINRQPSVITTVTGGNTVSDKIITEVSIRYSNDFTANPFLFNSMSKALDAMKTYNYNAVPVETVVKRNGNIISAEVNLYRKGASERSILLDRKFGLNLSNPISASSYTPAYDGRAVFMIDTKLELAVQFDEYDEKGRLLSYKDANGNRESVIYQGNNVVAKIANGLRSTSAGRNEVFYTSFEEGTQTGGIIFFDRAKSGSRVRAGNYAVPVAQLKPGEYILSYWKYDTSKSNPEWEYVESKFTNESGYLAKTINDAPHIYIDEVRLHPADAYMTTYTYTPGYGLSSETDAYGRTTYYLYNSYGLPSGVLNNERQQLKSMSYDNISN